MDVVLWPIQMRRRAELSCMCLLTGGDGQAAGRTVRDIQSEENRVC